MVLKLKSFCTMVHVVAPQNAEEVEWTGPWTDPPMARRRMSMAPSGLAHSLHNKHTKLGAIRQTVRDKSYGTHHISCVRLHCTACAEQNAL